MLVATWNVNSLNARLPRVEEWVTQVQPDVLMMQETKLADDKFPHLTFSALGYDSAHFGEGRWNGVAIISKVGLDDVHVGFRGDDPAAWGHPAEARLIWATCGPARCACVYVPNGREVQAEHYRFKLDWLARLRDDLATEVNPRDPFVIGGDWNIAPTDRDVWDIGAFGPDSTHVSAPEREALGAITDVGLRDTFRERYADADDLFSWWDYRGGNFHKRMGMRIDYLLSTPALADRAVSDLIDRNARKGTKPSDHAPVLAHYDV
ncbi:MAG: exodeoxyribonuclease III [Microthrixaceae bacterium]